MRKRRGDAMTITQTGSIPVLTHFVHCLTAHCSRRHVIALLALALTVTTPGPSRAAKPEGQLTWGVHISLAPTWFDPAETPGMITPFMVMYALHDAMVKPMPGKPLAPSLAESWTASEDG